MRVLGLIPAYNEADLIIGARDFRQIPLLRCIANTLGRWSFSWALGQLARDNQSGYRLLNCRLLADDAGKL